MPSLLAQTLTASRILPVAFAGWELAGVPQQGSDPRKIDSASSNVLKEDRFTDFEVATYKHDNRTLTIKAARFEDAAGSYAAFTFYRQPIMREEDIGALAASLNDRVLFFSGNILVDARFDRVTGMSGTQLRELAARLPKAKGPAAVLPTLPSHLPRKQLVQGTARYIIGPAAYSALSVNLSPELIDFSKSPELVWARFNGEAPGSAEVLLVAYPTPHIAIDKLTAYEQLPAPSGRGTSIAKRTGPIVVLVRGNISRSDAEKILSGVNYDANVTWNENAGQGKRDNIGNLVIAALGLAAILFIISVGAGAVFGFGRFYLPRFRAKKAGKTPDDGELTRLHLS
ncbi:MAG: hypothetical protein CXZ00_07130 [Acidobacteria bacterium]|nr:MAG: hypothetical protein CXZ00_07130 [Acidobacteriota bacterium]